MAETTNQRWAAHLAGSFARAGVAHVVISPGSRSTPLALAFADRHDLRCWPVIDERVAGFFALGLAKGSQAPVVLICTSGTAGAHYLPAVIEAAHSAWPLWVLTADRPWELHGFGAAQTMRQAGLYGSFVAAEVDLPAPEDSPAALKHLVNLVAMTVSRAPRRPLHFNVPFREPLAPAAPGRGPVIDVEPGTWLAARAEPRLDSITELLDRAERGVIVCGPRERDDGFGALVHQLGKHLGWPVLCEAASNARYGFDDSIAMYDALWRNERFARAAPDVLLRFGGGLTAKSMINFSAPVTIHVSDDGEVYDPAHGAQVVLEGPAVQVCQALLTAMKPKAAGAWKGSWLEAEARVRAALAQHSGISEPLLARDVVAMLPERTNLVLSSSMPIRDVDGFAPTSQGPLRVFSNRGLNGIDGVTSTALGIAVATGRPTALLIGDVAFLHDLGAWVLARQLGVSLTVVLVNNDGGGIFHFLPIADRTAHFERFFGTPHGIDFSHVAAMAGAALHTYADAQSFRATLLRALEGGLHLLEVKTNRAANVGEHRALSGSLSEVAA
jgi:2-succinyl-5-enolpyruvyl-6-hydroxy-3-cyclohexene-1-carboxylate synthase